MRGNLENLNYQPPIENSIHVVPLAYIHPITGHLGDRRAKHRTPQRCEVVFV